MSEKQQIFLKVTVESEFSPQQIVVALALFLSILERTEATLDVIGELPAVEETGFAARRDIVLEELVTELEKVLVETFIKNNSRLPAGDERRAILTNAGSIKTALLANREYVTSRWILVDELQQLVDDLVLGKKIKNIEPVFRPVLLEALRRLNQT